MLWINIILLIFSSINIWWMFFYPVSKDDVQGQLKVYFVTGTKTVFLTH